MPRRRRKLENNAAPRLPCAAGFGGAIERTAPVGDQAARRVVAVAGPASKTVKHGLVPIALAFAGRLQLENRATVRSPTARESRTVERAVLGGEVIRIDVASMSLAPKIRPATGVEPSLQFGSEQKL